LSWTNFLRTSPGQDEKGLSLGFPYRGCII